MEVGNLMAFDVDGTLVADYNSDRLMPHVLKFFQRWADVSIEKQGKCVLVSNQGGVGYRVWAEGRGVDRRTLRRYPTENVACERLSRIAGQISEAIGQSVRTYVSYQYEQDGSFFLPDGVAEWSWEWRKPGAGMLRRAMFDFGYSNGFVHMVGDRSSDESCAINAGVKFSWASEFFHEYF